MQRHKEGSDITSVNALSTSFNAFNRNHPMPFGTKVDRELAESPTAPRLEISEKAV